eukprot:181000-Amphidinium_carterae.1
MARDRSFQSETVPQGQERVAVGLCYKIGTNPRAHLNFAHLVPQAYKAWKNQGGEWAHVLPSRNLPRGSRRVIDFGHAGAPPFPGFVLEQQVPCFAALSEQQKQQPP